MAVTAGTYEILPLLDVTMAVEVAGNSTANKANARIWGRNGSNAQKWSLAPYGSSSTVFTVRDAETGKALDVAGGTAARGTNVQMYTYNGSAAQRWLVTEVGTQAVNGTAYPVVTLGAFGASTYAVDCAGGKAELRTNIQIWAANGTNAQRFVLVPAEWLAAGGSNTRYPGLPAATGGDGGTTAGVARGGTFASSAGTWYPAWAGSEPLWQVAYRTRTREAGADWMGAWSDWMSVADGSTAWDGFGAPGASNCAPTEDGGLLWSPDGVAFDNSATHNRTDVQVSARPWRARWGSGGVPAHGPTYTWTTTIVRPVSIADLGVVVSPDGLVVAWESDAPQGGNAVTLECDAWGTHTAVGDASGSTTIGQRGISAMPAIGDTVDVTMTMRTPDGLVVTARRSCLVDYESGHGATLELAAAPSADAPTIWVVSAEAPSTARAWLVVDEGHGTRYVELTEYRYVHPGIGPTISEWRVAPPLNRPWKVYASMVDGATWASTLATFDAVEDRGWHVTSQALDRELVLYVDAGDAPKANPTYSRSVDEVEVMGRERPVYVPGDSTEVGWTLEGVVYGDGYDDGIALHDWALHAGHVYYRSPDGEWRQAIVTGGSVDRIAPGAAKVTLTMKGEVW